jgi:2-octaprenyl-6-methoxyphenol hydroxylase
MNATLQEADLVIIGGGIVGLTLANALAPTGVKITILEQFDPAKLQEKKFDGRVLALAQDTRKVFEHLGVWNKIAVPEKTDFFDDHMTAGDINEIRIVDDKSPLFLHFDSEEVSDEPLGHVVEIRFIRRALYNSLSKFKNVNVIAPAEIESVKYHKHHVVVKTTDNLTIKAQLLLGADGRPSAVRKHAGIHTTKVEYEQTAITCVVKHEKHHGNTAIENFLPAGPFAILPMGSGHHSSIVWTEDKDLAPLYMDMDEAEFMQHLKARFSDYLGDVELASKRWSYPLSLVFADTYISHRMCLVGDAAHGIHPISGQGFNLGIRDVTLLAELIAETHRLGLDIGSMGMLKKYERVRKSDNMKMIAATDALNRLFSNHVTPMRAARRLGLKMVQHQPSLKKMFMKHAMGHVTDASPKIVRGEHL